VIDRATSELDELGKEADFICTSSVIVASNITAWLAVRSYDCFKESARANRKLDKDHPSTTSGYIQRKVTIFFLYQSWEHRRAQERALWEVVVL
jgi:hypothetical protein